MSLVVQLEFKARPETESEFVRLARALAAVAATEPGTLRYQWFVTQKPQHYAILEEYVDADAAEAHNNHVAPLLGQIFPLCELVSATFYGELNKYLRDWITGRPGITVNVPLPAP